MTLTEMLEQEVQVRERLGHPAILAMFVLRNGKPYQPAKRIGRKGPPHNCFQNATQAATDKLRYTYVEGFILHREHPLLPVHHAWVSTTGNDAMDPTLDADTHDYFGVPFTKTQLHRTLCRTGVYGLLDTGLGFNLDLMFEIDPELRGLVEAARTAR